MATQLGCAQLSEVLARAGAESTCMCRRVGNTGKMGALFGILYAIGAPVPKPGSITFIVRVLFANIKNFISGEQSSCHYMGVSGD